MKPAGFLFMATERRYGRRDFLKLTGLTAAGLAVGAVADKLKINSVVEAASVAEALPERISWEENLPFEASLQASTNCAIFSAAELMRMHVNRLRGGFQRGRVNQYSGDPDSDCVFNPSFISGITGNEYGNFNLIGGVLVNQGICRNHLAPNHLEVGVPTNPPSEEQLNDALNYRATSFETRFYQVSEMGGVIDELKRKLKGGPMLLAFPTHQRSLETRGGIVQRLPGGFEFVSSHACPLFAIDDNFDTGDGDRGALGLWWNSGSFDVAKAWMPYKYLTEDLAQVTDPGWCHLVDTLVLGFEPKSELPNKVYLPHVARGS